MNGSSTARAGIRPELASREMQPQSGGTLLHTALQAYLRKGRLRVTTDGGRAFELGDASIPESREVAVLLKGWATPLKLALDPDLQLGEAYAGGRLVLERGDIAGLLDLIGDNFNGRPYPSPIDALRRLTAGLPVNGRAAARRNVQRHYDLPESFYREFLDSDLQYSCAYFEDPRDDIETAQAAKARHIIAKLAIEPGQHVLDIGSGWGALALQIARSRPGVRVTGVSLSEPQVSTARRRAESAGLSDRVRFELRDYRDLEGRFDRIVSVGMFEHVGPRRYAAFLNTISRLLTDRGVALLHTIGRRAGGPSNAWIARHIFQGGYVPRLDQIAAAVARTPLWVTDVEALRLHYAYTLRRWRERFLAARDRLEASYPESFLRGWEFYLAACEMGFRRGNLLVYQVQLAAARDALPITRDYMAGNTNLGAESMIGSG